MSIQSVSRAAALCTLVSAAAAPGEVDLSWAPQPRTIAAGVTFEINLIATADMPGGQDQAVSAMDVIVSWNPAALELIGIVDVDPPIWWVSGFLPDPELDGLNNTFADGNALYTALANPGPANAPHATPDGLTVVTFRFVSLAETDPTQIVIEPSLGDFSVTRVFGTDFPNQNVTGDLSNALVTIVPPSECDGDGGYDLREFQRFQACFTGTLEPSETPAYPPAPALCCSTFDYDDDGDVDRMDYGFYSGLITGPVP